MITWSDGSHDRSGGLEDRLIDGPLVWSELPVGWEGAGDVWGVAVVLSTHVKQTAGDDTSELVQSNIFPQCVVFLGQKLQNHWRLLTTCLHP